MADSVVKLRVDSKEYESKIKRAAENVRAFGENCRKAGQSMDKADKETVEYVQALGRMEAAAKNTKGKVNEMSNAFTDLSIEYKQLTDQEKQSPFGQALAQSLEQLRQRTITAKQELSDLNKQLQDTKTPELSTPNMGKGMGRLDGMLAVFGGNMMTKAAGWAAGFASEIADCVKQGVELAKAGEGIRIAFDRLNRPDLLDKLREATHGTVTDLELMKQAVKFNDFNLSLDEMGTMLAFAQQKAKDTGQSVDYMVDSIVTGLGRKSLMILDNLGLSSADVKEKMKETGDMTKAVGAIIREQMAKAGDYVETAADRAAQANVSLQNKMEELGRKFAPVEEASNHLWTSMKIAILDVVGGPLTSLLNGLTEAGRLRNALSRMNGEEGSGNTKVDQQLKRLKTIRQAGGSDFIYNTSYNKMLGDYDSQIADIQKKLDNGGKWESKEKPGLYHYESTKVLNDQLRALKVMRDRLVAGAKELSEPVKVDMPSITTDETKPVKKGRVSSGSGSTKTPKTEQQLNTEQISRLNQEYINATDARKAAIRDEIKVLQDRNTEIQRLIDESNGKDIYPTGSLKDYQKQVADLTKAQQEATSGREWDEYARKIDEVNRKMSILKGNLPKDSEATLTMTVDAKDVDKLREKYHNAVFTPIVKPRVEEPKAENMPPLLPSPQQEAKPIWTMPAFDPLADAVKEPEQVAVTVTADTDEALKSLRELMDQYEGAQITIKVKEQMETGLSGVTQDSLSAWKGAQEKSLAKQQIGSEDYMATYANIIDTTTLSNLVSTAIKNGVKIDSNAIEGLWEQIIGGGNIPDDVWKSLVDTINTRMQELGLEPIKLNVDTGNVTQAGKRVNDSWRAAASAVQAVGSALQGIDSQGAKVAGIVGQAIANIALGFAQATAKDSKLGVFGWIAAIAGGLGTMLGTISAIKSATAGSYAQGGIVPGNDYNDGLTANVSSGELILNKAQQDNIAGLLDQSKVNLHLSASFSAEQIRLVLDSNGRRTGRGEYITKNFS